MRGDSMNDKQLMALARGASIERQHKNRERRHTWHWLILAGVLIVLFALAVYFAR